MYRFILSAILLLYSSTATHAQDIPLRSTAMDTVVVMVDPALSVPMAHIARAYAADKESGIALSVSTGEDISQQMLKLSQADVLITAHTGWLEQLKLQGLIDIYSETPVAKNRLALLAPRKSKLKFKLNDKFPTGKLLLEMGDNRLFVIPNPAYLPEGTMAREAMRRMSADIDLEPYTAYLQDREGMYDLIRDYNAYGLFLYTDAKDREFKVIDLVPERFHTPIAYRAVVLAGNHMDHARRFVDYLKSRSSRQLFTHLGFVPN